MKKLRVLLFSAVASVATLGIAKADTIYVTNSGNDTITEIGPGGVQTTFGNSSELSTPTGIAIATSGPNAGDLYVANNDTGNISVFTQSGTYLGVFASGLSNPRGMAFDSSGNLYVSNQSANSITKITPTGVETTFASGLDFPNGLAFDASGNLFVANGLGDNKIFEITPGGIKTQLTFTGTPLDGPNGLAFDKSGNLYVVNHDGSNVEKITPGNTGAIFTTQGLSGPKTLGFDSNGDLFVTDFNNNTVTEYNSAGQLISTFSGTFNGPCFLVAVNSSVFVPEPSTYAMMLGGLGLLVLWSRRRKPAMVKVRASK